MPHHGRKAVVGALGIGFVLLFFFASCSKVKGPYYGDAAGGPVPSESAIFPHPEGWGLPSGHGKFVINLGAGQCSPCHSDDPEKASGRGCKSCHVLYPHLPADVWPGIQGHGKHVRDKGNANECATACHGANLAGGYDPAGKKSCVKCHASYPAAHAGAEWPKAGHGRFVRSAGISTECQTMCHRADAPAAMKLKGCSDCHRSYPGSHADARWKDAGHARFLSSYGGVAQADCVLCHGRKLEGSGMVVACTSCHHAGGAGTAAWNTAGEHGLAATNDLSKCLPCHGSDLKGNAVVAGCVDCHHRNWAQLHGAPWVDIAQHGAKGKTPSASCRVCHGSDLKGGASGIDCFTCHGGAYPHETDWRNPAKHGPAAAKLGLSKCAACHPLSRHSCKGCHHDNVPGWLASVHGGVTLAQLDGCKVCHGANLEGSPIAPGCAACHGPGMSPHLDPGVQPWVPAGPVDFGDPIIGVNNHGVQARNLDKCRICHGLDAKGGFSGGDCYECHDVGNHYPHDPAVLPAWRAAVSGEQRTSIAGRRWGLMISHCWTPCHVVRPRPGGLPEIPMGIYGGVRLMQVGSCGECHTL